MVPILLFSLKVTDIDSPLLSVSCLLPTYSHHLLTIYLCNMTADPWPPPTHKEIKPVFRLSRFICLSIVKINRVPDAPTGCPRAMAPPFTLRIDRSIVPVYPSYPNVLANEGDSRAARQLKTCTAKASLIS